MLSSGGTMSCVLRPASSVLHPASSVQSITAKVLKIMSPDFMQIFVMCAVCRQKGMVAPPVILAFLWCQKHFLTF